MKVVAQIQVIDFLWRKMWNREIFIREVRRVSNMVNGR